MPIDTQYMQTYSITAPLATHFRKASCEEVNCPDFLNGWRVRKDALNPQMLHTATHSGRSYTELHVAEGENWLVFPAGQPCFKASQHKLPIGKPEIYYVRGGDQRGNPLGTKRIHIKPEFWVEDFAENLDNIRTAQERA